MLYFSIQLELSIFPGVERACDESRGGVGNSHILIQHSAEFGVRGLLIIVR